MNKILLILVALTSFGLFPFSSSAQDGPGGIGNSSNLVVWLDANSISQGNNTPVTFWTDISGNNITASALSSFKPRFMTNVINGRPVLRFNGNRYMTTSSISALNNTDNVSWFSISQTSVSHTGHIISSSYTSGAGSGSSNLWKTFYSTSNNYQTFSRSTTGTNGSGSLSLGNTNNFVLLGSVWNGTANTVKGYNNGALQGTQTGVTALPTTHNFLRIGATSLSNAGQRFKGDVAEILVFNFTLNDAQRIILENYMAVKYALTVTNDFYAFEATHPNDLAGIGMSGGGTQDDSRGTGIIEIANPDDLDNGDFLIWAHDNGSLTVNTTNVPGTFTPTIGSRFNRVWRADETGDVGVYDFTIDITGLPLLGPDANDYQIMFDDDGDFSNGGTTFHAGAATYDVGTQTVTWSGVDIPDGAYFTIAYNEPAIWSITTGGWKDKNTWNCTCIPTLANNVLISDGDVVTVDSIALCDGLTVNATATLNFTNDDTLFVNGNINSVGTFDATNGELNLQGSSSQLLTFNTATIDVLTINNPNGVQVIAGDIDIVDVLNVFDGEFNAGTNFVTLVSDATQTARIGLVSGDITGSMIIQRFIDARDDGYSDISSPLMDGTFAEMADDILLNFVAYTPDYYSPSCWGYSESLWDYIAIENSTDLMEPGVGYEIWLTSDGDTTTTFSPSTISFQGTPNYGDVEFFPTLDNDGWNLIGNPYASYLDWDLMADDHALMIAPDFYYYDETLEDYNIAFYGDGEKIATAQGFWIEVYDLGTQDVFTFIEDYKTADNDSDFRKTKKEKFGVRITSNSVKYTASTYLNFDISGDLSYMRGHDITYLKVQAKEAPVLYTQSLEGKKLKVNDLSPKSTLTIPVTFIAGKEGTYSISSLAIESAIEEGYDFIVVEDLKTGELHDLTQGSFEFIASPFDDENRFVLHLRKSNEISTGDVKFINSIEGVFVDFAYDESTKASISVYNLAGQEIVASQNVTANNNTVKVQLPKDYSGVFIIKVLVNDKVITERFYK